MPNWCENRLIVFGDDVQKFLDKCEKNYGPEDWGLLGAFNIPDYNSDLSNWYTANCEAWGTKWDVPWNDVTLESDKDLVQLWFVTAESPPWEWFVAVGKMYPTLRFELLFREDGMQFAGMAISKGGVAVIDEFDLDNVQQKMGDAKTEDFEDHVEAAYCVLEDDLNERLEREIRHREIAEKMMEE